MSLSDLNFKIQKLVDPKLNLETNLDKKYTFVSGCEETYLQVYSAQTFTTSSLAFNCPVPSTATFVDRQLYLKATFSLTFTNPVPGDVVNNPLQNNFDALRDYPLSKLINTVSCTMNGATVNCQLGDIIQVLNRFYSFNSSKALKFSTTPSATDKYQQYEQGTGCNNNPLGGIGDQNIDGVVPRGAYSPDSLPVHVVNTNTWTYTFTVCEPLYISPFVWQTDNALALYGLQNVTLNMQLGSPARMWSHAATGAFAAMQAPTLSWGVNPPQLLFQYYTKRIESIPKTIAYNYYNTQVYSQELGNIVGGGGSYVVNFSPLVLNGMFKNIYICARESNQVKQTPGGITSTDTFLNISELKLVMGAKTILNPQSDGGYTLFQTSRKNGYCGSLLDWNADASTTITAANYQNSRQGFGSIVCLTPADLAMSEYVVPGSNLKTNLSVSCKVTNNRYDYTTGAPVGVNTAFYIIVVDEGLFECSTESPKCIANVNVLNEKDVIDAHKVQGSIDDYNRAFGSGVHVGGFDFNDIWGPIKSVAETVLPLIKTFALGKPKKRRLAGVVTGGENDGTYDGFGVSAGGVMAGGSRTINRNDLRNY